MEKEILERLDQIEKEVLEAKQEILAEIQVYSKKNHSDLLDIRIFNEVLKDKIEKYINYKDYYEKMQSNQG